MPDIVLDAKDVSKSGQKYLPPTKKIIQGTYILSGQTIGRNNRLNSVWRGDMNWRVNRPTFRWETMKDKPY